MTTAHPVATTTTPTRAIARLAGMLDPAPRNFVGTYLVMILVAWCCYLRRPSAVAGHRI